MAKSFFLDMMIISHVSEKFIKSMFIRGFTKWEVDGFPFDSNENVFDSDDDCLTFHPNYMTSSPVKCVKVIFEQEFD